MPAEKAGNLNRRHRRRLIGEGRVRTRTGKATGTTPHFRMWMADLRIKSALQRMKTSQLAKSAGDDHPQAASALSFLAEDRRYRKLSAIVEAERADLLSISGIGPKRLDALAAYLRSKRVQVRWDA